MIASHNLPAHLENSCDNTDKVAMEIQAALHMDRDEDQRFRPSTAAYLLKQPSLVSPENCIAGAINLMKIFCVRDLCDTITSDCSGGRIKYICPLFL